MAKNFLGWFAVLVLSFFGSSFFGWNQGKAFVIIYLTCVIILILTILSRVLFEFSEVIVITPLIVLSSVGIFLFELLIIWGASIFFDVNIYVTFELITLGQCWISNSSSKE